MAERKSAKTPTGESSGRKQGRAQPHAQQGGDKVLVPVFTAVILLLIAAAVAVVMAPDKTKPSPVGRADTPFDARSALPPETPESPGPTLPGEEASLDEVVYALEIELGRKDRCLGRWPKGHTRDPRRDPYLSSAPVVGSKAEQTARLIPADVTGYPQALKAIVERRFPEARKILDDLIAAQDENPLLSAEEQARLYTARGDADYFDCRFATAAGFYSQAAEIAPDNPYIQYAVARALLRTPPPNQEQALVAAIQTLIELEAKSFTKDQHPVEWGLTKLALGVALWNFSLGDPAVNRQRAIEAYQAALEVFTREDSPVEWARTQGFLGELYASRPDGERAHNLAQAMKHYRLATEVITRRGFPRQWASLQAKLGAAYTDLPTGDRRTNLQAAVLCYEQALAAVDPEDAPYDWASIQRGLGTAYSNLEVDKRENLTKSIACYEQALTAFTREDFPSDWGTLHNNLANNHISLASLPGTPEKDRHIEKAVAYLQDALQVLKHATHPLEWASAQYNLGAAFRLRASGDHRANLEQALKCFDLSLSIFREESFPDFHAAVRDIRDETRAELEALPGAE